jgi:hypothetical protein
MSTCINLETWAGIRLVDYMKFGRYSWILSNYQPRYLKKQTNKNTKYPEETLTYWL